MSDDIKNDDEKNVETEEAATEDLAGATEATEVLESAAAEATAEPEALAAEEPEPAEPAADAEPEPEAEAEPEAPTEPEPEAKPEPKPEPEPEAKPEPKKDLKPKKERGKPAAKKAAEELAKGSEKPSKKEAKKPAAKVAAAKGTSAHKGLPTAAWACISVALLVVGVLVGYYLIAGGRGASTVSLSGKTTLSSGELDSAIATYTYNGQTTNITAREVIAQNSTIENAANDDGTYDVPSASNVLSFAQTEIVVADAESRGLSVSDDEVTDYITNTMGSDTASLADSYGIDEDTVTDLVRSSLLITKLRDDVCTTEVPDAPTSPTEPEDDAEDTPTADYATYIINLLGDEWDSEAGTWATTDGEYYETLSGYEITNDSATYAAAEAAYNIAYSAYTTAANAYSEEFVSYYNGLLANSTIQLGSLVM